MTNTLTGATTSREDQPQSVSNQVQDSYKIFMRESEDMSLERFNKRVAEARARKARRGAVAEPRIRSKK